MNYEYNQLINNDNILKNLFISEIFKFLYLTNINKKMYKISKPLNLSYNLSDYNFYIGKTLLYKLNIDLILIKIKFDLNLQIYLYKIKNIFYTIVYNYLSNKVISIN